MNGELLKTWKHEDYKLNLFYLGGEKLGYQFFVRGKVLFEGKDFRPSPLHCIDSLESVYSLLGFLTVRPGDTDEDYFKDYTPGQLAWTESFECETLSMWVQTQEERLYAKGRK